MLQYLKNVLDNMPNDWLSLTTHRLDIYNENLAKVQFLEHFEVLFDEQNYETSALSILPTAYDYIRLGHPLSCILEWAIAKHHLIDAASVISFSSQTIPLLAVLRKNLIDNVNTQVVYTDKLPDIFDADTIRDIYDYKFVTKHISSVADIEAFDGSTILVSQQDIVGNLDINLTKDSKIDFYISLHNRLGSIIIANGAHNEKYIAEIQHVRRRESIAMTPTNCVIALRSYIDQTQLESTTSTRHTDHNTVVNTIKNITGTDTNPLVASSGLSIQYAILMGLVHHARENHTGKAIKIIVPPNCYGGTNDQARRVAACLQDVEVMDLPVDGGYDMVQSIDKILGEIAELDAVPYIIAEIPTNPRVEVPDLQQLKEVLSRERHTTSNTLAVDPVFILDQTFCPNVHFLGDDAILSEVRTISFSSGSKFPSGGKCTAGYCIGNQISSKLIDKIDRHLRLCDNEATDQQLEILANQMPSMIKRIADAYRNTRDFVTFIQETLPAAKINFVSEELAKEGFTPSVFSLDLPTKGETDMDKEAYKRELNDKLINLMITEIPEESKYCVSYGQLRGCYWTIPATSTQGTTKEGDKDYIVRASLSPNLDLELHKEVFQKFVDSIND